MDQAARGAGSSVVQVSAGYADSRKSVLVANTECVMAEDSVVRTLARASPCRRRRRHRDADRLPVRRPHHRLGAVRRGRRRRVGGDGRPPGDDQAEGTAGTVGKPARGDQGRQWRRAVPRGRPATVSKPTSCRRAPACTRGKVGELVASPLVTVVDDGTMDGEWGTWAFDDEGHATQRNVLIENGVLTDYMWDYLRTRRSGTVPSGDQARQGRGNGRRESYVHLPMVRMTNTFVLDGPETIPTTSSARTEHGVYVAQLGGGVGEHGHRRLRVRHGRGVPHRERRDHRADPRGEPHRQRPPGAARHRRVANDFAMGNPGTCGKDGQGVPVGTGQPTFASRR